MTATKADFDSIYNQPDDFEYYRTLGELDYQIPQHGADMFVPLLDARGVPDSIPTVLDLCCSYGVGGVLLKTDLHLTELYAPYLSASDRDTVVAESVKLRREHRLPNPPTVFGLDAASNAVRFAEASGSVDRGFVEDLETNDLSPELKQAMGEVDMIVTTGGIGYVTGLTLGKLLDACPTKPWVAAYCLRAYDYSLERDTLAAHGLTTEKGATPVRQRRFVDEAEQEWAVEQVKSLGLDPTLEESGWYYADFYLSRPAEDAAARPLSSLMES